MSEIYNQAQENFFVDRGLTPLPQPHLTGMKLRADIVLGDFVFNTIDEYGVTWVITDIEGWWSHPEPDMPDIPRGFGDGSYDVKGRYQARMITLTGSFLTPTPDLVEAARDRLIIATDLVYKGAWLKTGTDGKRASFVRLSGAPQIQTVTARGRTDFSIGLKAADPIKYSWNDQEPSGYNIIEIPARNRTSGSTGIETIVNSGTVAVPVQLEIQGPIIAPAYIVTNKDTATQKLLAVVSGLRGRLTSSVVNKELSFSESQLVDILTLTTRAAHGLLVGDIVEISGLSESYLNGEFEVYAVNTETTVQFLINDPSAASIQSIVSKKLLDGVATIETNSNHGFEVGNSIFIADVDSVFNGTYSITAKTNTTFSYAKSRGVAQTVIGKRLNNNIATLSTSVAHGFIVGDIVTVSISDINYDGEFQITSISSSGDEFSYSSTRTNTKTTTTKSMSNDVATITSTNPHGLIIKDSVTISGIDSTFDGTRTVESIPTPTTFTYNLTRETEVALATRQRFSGVATFITGSTSPGTEAPSHGLLVGEEVTIKGSVGNATYPTSGIVTSTPNLNTFTIANPAQPDEGAINITVAPTPTVFASKKYLTSKQLIGGTVTVFTPTSHGFFVGEQVIISGLGSPYDGTFTISAVPFANALSYIQAGSNATLSNAGAVVSTRGRAGSSVTIVTSTPHNFANNQYVTISNMDSAAATLNGTYVVTVISPTVFKYTTTTSTNVGTVAGTATVLTRERVGTLATVVTAAPHGLSNGASISVSGMDSNASSLNGTYTITVVNSTTITYTTATTGNIATENVNAGSGGIVIQGAFARVTRSIASTPDNGFFTAIGSIPFAEASGTASVSDDILAEDGGAISSNGVAVKKNNIPFTPGLTGTSIDFGPDILEIDTLSKDVSLNGATSGGRAKLDVFTDFFFLETGSNTIEFYDSSDSASNSLLKLYYRSGWLG
jgi:hypothetical protein